ncbi:MAG: hypothetical protein AAGA54_32625 [Myxococcota bacterium]
MRSVWGIIGALCVTVGGCTSSDVFQCQSDGQCVNGDAAGACQPNGYCSFADAGCPSGFRYADSAPPGLAGACVEEDVGTSNTTGCVGEACTDPTSGPGPSTTNAPPTTAPGTTQAATVTATTTGGAESSGTMESGGSTSTGSSSSSSSTDDSTGAAIECPQFVEEFSDGQVDTAPWTWLPLDPPIMSEAEDRLRFSIPTGHNGFASIVYPEVDLSGDGYVVAHLVAPPQDDFGQFLLRVLDADGLDSAEMVLTGSTELSVRINSVAVEFIALSPVTELWLEIFVVGDQVHFAYSTDGSTFLSAFIAPTPFDFVSCDLQLMGGAYDETTAASHLVEIDDFEFCEAPFPEA